MIGEILASRSNALTDKFYMPKYMLSVLALTLFFSGSLSSQNYISVSSGVIFPSYLQGQDIHLIQNSLGRRELNSTFKPGWGFSAAVGRMFDSNLGVELEGSYTAGSVLLGTAADMNVRTKTRTYNIAALGILRISWGNVLPYVKIGPLAAFPNLHQDGWSIHDGSANVELSGKMTIGFLTKFGVQYNIKSCTVFLEGGFTALSWSPDHIKYTAFGKSGEHDIGDHGVSVFIAPNTEKTVIIDRIQLSQLLLKIGLLYEL